MSWMQKLYQTYEAGVLLDLSLEQQLMPISHTSQNAHINVVLNAEGNFSRAAVLEKTQIVLPATERNAGRSGSGAMPYALADKIQYVAGDYFLYTKKKKEFFESYRQQLQIWCESPYAHPKVQLVYRYIQKGTVVADLINHGKLLYTEDQVGNKRLLNLIGKSSVEKWTKEKVTPEIYKVLTKTPVKGDSNNEDQYEFDQGDALICWSVEIPGDPISETWKDPSIQASWISFDTEKNSEKKLCYVSGSEQVLSNKHPAKIRHNGDKAKLISSNDNSGYTYLGKFLDETQACGISFEVSQKAHNALRWLVNRQGFRNGDQVYVAWAVSGVRVPQPLDDSVWDAEDDYSDFEESDEPVVIPTQKDEGQNLGQAYAIKLRNYMAGYSARIQANEQIILMGIDSATTGRMGVIFYREWLRDEFFERLTAWHSEFAWWQRHTRQLASDNDKKPKTQTIWPICAPLPRDIAIAAHGDIDSDAHKTLRKKTVERLLSCIIDKSPLPRDILDQCVRNASNRIAYARDKRGNQPLWEKNLGIACALYKGYHQRTPELQLRRDYAMALEENRLDRDYLYGRLLAVADYIEEFALYKSNENRSTNAARLMQRFADRPFDTWRTIELSLQPYMQRLQGINAGFLTNRQKDIENIMVLIEHADFTSNAKLSGEFLLGYHCQRHYYKHKSESAINSADAHDANPESGEQS